MESNKLEIKIKNVSFPRDLINFPENCRVTLESIRYCNTSEKRLLIISNLWPRKVGDVTAPVIKGTTEQQEGSSVVVHRLELVHYKIVKVGELVFTSKIWIITQKFTEGEQKVIDSDKRASVLNLDII